MKKVLFSLFVLLYSISQGQNYRLVNPNRESYFEYPVFNQTMFHAIRIDSITVYGSDSIFHNYKLWEYENPYTCIDTKDTNFFIDHVILKPNGDHVIFNKNNDTILIKSLAALTDQWVLYRYPNGNKIVAYVVAISPTTVLGDPDTVKAIQLQAFDAGGNPITNTFNGKEIRIAKNNGIQKFFNTFNFPNDNTSYDLVGKSNPEVGKTNLRYSQIKDWDVGDEFHYYAYWNNGSGDAMYEYELLTITAKTTSSTGDTVGYTKYRQYYKKHINPWPNVTITISQGNANEQVINSSPTIVNKLSYEPELDTLNMTFSGYTFQYDSPAFPGKRMKKSSPHFYYNQVGDSCYSQGIGQCIFWEFTYLEKVGLFVQDHGGGPDCYVKNLVYFKKGSETWGTPIDWQTLLSSNELENDFDFSVYPNPSDGKFTITTSFKPERILISSVIGETLLILSNPNNGNNELDLSKFPKGIYLITIQDERGKEAIRKVVIE